MPRKLKVNESLSDIWLELLFPNGLPSAGPSPVTSSTLGELGAYFRALLGGCVPKSHLLKLLQNASTVALEEGSLDSRHSTHFSSEEEAEAQGGRRYLCGQEVRPKQKTTLEYGFLSCHFQHTFHNSASDPSALHDAKVALSILGADETDG